MPVHVSSAWNWLGCWKHPAVRLPVGYPGMRASASLAVWAYAASSLSLVHAQGTIHVVVLLFGGSLEGLAVVGRCGKPLAVEKCRLKFTTHQVTPL